MKNWIKTKYDNIPVANKIALGYLLMVILAFAITIPLVNVWEKYGTKEPIEAYHDFNKPLPDGVELYSVAVHLKVNIILYNDFKELKNYTDSLFYELNSEAIRIEPIEDKRVSLSHHKLKEISKRCDKLIESQEIRIAQIKRYADSIKTNDHDKFIMLQKLNNTKEDRLEQHRIIVSDLNKHKK